ncbi:hypothetical protein B0H17DRAFT_1049915, partial [Mycena rosella]
MHLQRLAADLRKLFGDDNAVDLKHPLFLSVTHLDLLDGIDTENKVWMKCLSTLPALTHLALTAPNEDDLPLMRDILGASPRMQILLAVFDDSSACAATSFAAGIHFVHARLVVGLDDGEGADWERDARGGEGMWNRAENFVARKRRGEIKDRELLFYGRR